FSNLLSNAFKHGDPEQAIELRVEGTPTRVAIVVRNAGAIPADHLPWLFDPFRSISHRKSGAGGLGLGLFITKQIVVAHGGSIDVRSCPEDGTAFEVLLPRSAA